MIRGIEKGVGPTAPDPKPSAQKQRLKEACEEFESIMTGFLLKSMRESIDRAEKPEQAREIYESLLDDAISKDLAKRQGSGLADTLYKQLSPLVRENPKKL
jgi:Rod binding domain-containing protein